MGKILRCGNHETCTICGLCKEHCLRHNLRAIRVTDEHDKREGFRRVDVKLIRNAGDMNGAAREKCAQLYSIEKDKDGNPRVAMQGRADSGPVKDYNDPGRMKGRERRADSRANIGGVQ